MGWLSDWFRTGWALLYWNWRKTLFRVRRPAFSPCQNPSDSGRAWETRCEACFGWRQPARFHRVCPLLRPAPDGSLKCSVNTADVRPFWLRAAFFYGAAFLALYLLAVGGTVAVMRTIGYPVSVRAVAWPPAWKEINHARSAYFLRRAETAYAQDQINEAVLSLRLAYDYHPGNYDAGLMLARIWQTGRPDIANQLYGRLLQEHPAQRPATAQHWLRALLPRADYAAIEELAAAALQFDAEHAGAWLNALLFATERTGNHGLLERLESSVLPAGVTDLLRVERLLREPEPFAGLEALASPRPSDVPEYVVHHQIRRLISLGFAPQALDLIAIERRRLSDYDRVALELDALATINHRRLRMVAFDNLVGQTARLPAVELLAAHLIRHPDPGLYDRWRRQLDFTRFTEPAERHAATLAVYCVAGVHADEAQLTDLGQQLREATGADYAALASAEAFFQDARTGRIQDILPLLQPLALEINYALLARFETRPPSAERQP